MRVNYYSEVPIGYTSACLNFPAMPVQEIWVPDKLFLAVDDAGDQSGKTMVKYLTK